MTLILETERLQLRQLTLADAEFMLHLLNTPDWLRYIGDRGVRTLAQAEQFLQAGILKSYAEKGFGFYLVLLRSTGQALGICGLIKRNGLDEVDIGYAFLPEHSGKGYATESTAATLVFAQNTLGLKKLLAITTQDNQGSIRVLQKVGFSEAGTVVLPGEKKELNLFSKELSA